MSLTSTGVPPLALSTIRLMSSSERISPTPRMMYCSEPFRDDVPADIRVVVLDRVVDVVEREVVLQQLVRIDEDRYCFR